MSTNEAAFGGSSIIECGLACRKRRQVGLGRACGSRDTLPLSRNALRSAGHIGANIGRVKWKDTTVDSRTPLAIDIAAREPRAPGSAKRIASMGLNVDGLVDDKVRRVQA